MSESDLSEYLAGYLRARSTIENRPKRAIAEEMIECYEASKNRGQAKLTPGRGAANTASAQSGWQATVVRILKALPKGRWTTYGELGQAAGHDGALDVGQLLAGSDIENACQVLRKGGTVSPDFKWGSVDHGDVHAYLRNERGIQFDAQLRADPAQHLDVKELRKLAGTP